MTILAYVGRKVFTPLKFREELKADWIAGRRVFSYALLSSSFLFALPKHREELSCSCVSSPLSCRNLALRKGPPPNIIVLCVPRFPSKARRRDPSQSLHRGRSDDDRDPAIPLPAPNFTHATWLDLNLFRSCRAPNYPKGAQRSKHCDRFNRHMT